jgi:RNA polymerase sigma-70 factor (ECF subfamily)
MAGKKKAGEQDASVASMRELARLWVRSQPAVSAYITANVVDMHHADDLVQEVAQAVAEKIGSYDRGRSFTAWALGIARNRLLKYYRTRSRDRLVLSEVALERLAVSVERVNQQAEERREALRTCLEEVRGRRRTVLDLRYGEGSKVNDIAEQLGMSASAVSVMLFRVRAALMTCVERQLNNEGA